jgi:hypothetical protein
MAGRMPSRQLDNYSPDRSPPVAPQGYPAPLPIYAPFGSNRQSNITHFSFSSLTVLQQTAATRAAAPFASGSAVLAQLPPTSTLTLLQIPPPMTVVNFSLRPHHRRD